MAISQTQTKAPKHYMMSILFLIVVLVITALIFAYKTTVSSQNNKIISEITDTKSVIATLREDKDIQAYELYDSNKKRLNDMAYLSSIPKFYSALTSIGRKYNIDFSNFAYTKGVITVTANTSTDSSDGGYAKFRDLIADFRATNAADGEEESPANDFIFDLEFVKSFIGAKSIRATMEFIVKPEVIKDAETEKKEALEEAIKK